MLTWFRSQKYEKIHSKIHPPSPAHPVLQHHTCPPTHTHTQVYSCCEYVLVSFQRCFIFTWISKYKCIPHTHTLIVIERNCVLYSGFCILLLHMLYLEGLSILVQSCFILCLWLCRIPFVWMYTIYLTNSPFVDVKVVSNFC